MQLRGWSMLRGIGVVSLFALATQAQTAQITGRVVTETNAAVGGARVLARCAAHTIQTLSDPTGAFRLDIPLGAACRISVEREGYFPITDRALEDVGESAELRLVLAPLREVVQETEVREDRIALDLETTSTRQTLSGAEIVNVPMPATNNLRASVRIVPGVVQGNTGGLHINGGGSEQTFYSLDGFNLSDPLTGTFETRLSVESVSAVQVNSGPMPAEFGKGSAGTMMIRSRTGDDRFRASATNFIPGVEFRKGVVIGNFTPRVNFSGPIRRGRAWFSNSTDLQYDQHIVPELPVGEDRTQSWRGSNYLTTQVNLTPSNILNTGFLATFWTAPRTGLSALSPLETTVDRRARQWFAHVKDQMYFSRGAMLEFGYAANRTFGREIPQGQELYLITPSGRRGNWFRNATQEGGRDQFMANGFLPSFDAAGGHQIKLGMDLNRVRYRQDITRTGLLQFRGDGTVMRMVEFEGAGALTRNNFEAAMYLQDQWKVRPGLVLDAGLRWDWDHLIRRNNFAPRLGFAWSPARHENTKISGGAGLVYDASNLLLLTRPNDQLPYTTYFGQDGTPIRTAAASLFLPADQRLQSTSFFTFSAGIEHRFPHSIHLRLNYLGKRGTEGLSFWNTPDESCGVNCDVIYRLRNQRQDRYDSAEVTVRQTFRGQYEWLASYIRSSARSNAASDITPDEPFIISNNSGPMAWDTPNRLLSWGYLPTFWKQWAAAYMVEWRTGFPYSVIGEDGRVRDAVNSQRFPTYFEANLHAEWKLRFHKNLWALRGGVNNITNRRNPTVVNNLMGARDFLNYYGGFGRSLNFRIRWLGRVQ